MYRLEGTCNNCGALYATSPGEDAFCEYCDFPLPTPLTELSSNVATLHQLLRECIQRSDWPGATQVVQRLADETDNPQTRGRYLRSLGSMFSNKLEDKHQAMICWEQALAENASDIRSFVSLAEALRCEERWADLEGLYRKMIKRTINSTNSRVVLEKLWTGLGCVYRDHLDRPGEATQCFERAQKQ